MIDFKILRLAFVLKKYNHSNHERWIWNGYSHVNSNAFGRLFENIVISALKPKLAKHREFGELSKKFVMVNTDDNEEPQGEQFDVDGKYVPRIFFLGNINVINLA